MNKIKNSKIILVESGKSISAWRARKYESVYLYAGNSVRGQKLPSDFLNLMDRHLAEYRAGKILDLVYKKYVSNNESDILNEVMGDKRAYMVIKKIILYALGDMFLSFILAEEFKHRYKIRSSIDFLPAKFSYELYRVVSEIKGLLPDNINIPKWYLDKIRRQETIKNLLYQVGLSLYPFALSLFMKVERSKNINKESYSYGVHIWNSSFIFRRHKHHMDFLEGKNGLSKDNTLYIMDKEMSRENIKKISNSGYSFCYFKDMIKQLSVSRYLKYIYLPSIKIIKSLSSKRSNRMLVTKGYLKMLRWHILWEIFYSKYKVGTFIVVQEPGDVPRALLQKKRGAKNMLIFMSTSYDSVYRSDMNAHFDSYYSFMIYDKLVTTRMSVEYFKKNNNFIREYVENGILRSDLIFKVKNNGPLKEEIKNKLKIPKDKIIIGFFDTAIGRMGIMNNQEGINMMNDICHLLETNKNWYFVYKSRGGNKDLNHRGLKNSFDRLMAHDRILCADTVKEQYDVQYFIGICDLVIGVFTSSLPLESVVGGVKTVCYIPSERYNKDVFTINTFPNFCAYGYKELKERTDYWLNKCTDDDFHSFQNKYIKRYIDKHCDGQATTRLHSLLELPVNLTTEPLMEEKIGVV